LAQDPKPSADPTFQTKVNLVLVPVVVRDAAGRPIGNLTRDDFQLFDKGKRQTISSFSVVEHAGAGALRIDPARDAATRRGPGAEPASAAKSRPKRYVIYVFDDLNTLFTYVTYAREAALRHFKGGLPATDRAAISTFSGRTTLAFTNDKAKLEDSVMKLRLRPRLGHGPTPPCPDVSYYLADFIINRNDKQALEAVKRQTMECAHVGPDMAEMMAKSAARQELMVGEEATRVSLDAIDRTVRVLAQMPGQRLIVLASPGFFAQTPGTTRALAGVLDLAARANVTISTLDTRGVDTTGLMEASRRSAMSSVEREYYQQSARAAADVLADLAEGSGGTFFHNNNDLTMGFTRVTSAPEFSYVLGFSPAALRADGSFHRLRIRLTNEKGVNLQARKGYYALKHASEPDAVEAEIHDAVFSRGEMSEIPLDVATQVSKSGSGDARLMVAAKVHPTWLHFQKAAGRNRDSLTVVSALFDEEGGYVTGTRKTVNLFLRDETLAQTNAGINVQSDFVMQPGTYLLRVVVREAAGKAMSAYNATVTIR
jgi:VWFA-related protein